MIRQNQKYFNALNKFIDLLLIIVSLIAGYFIRFSFLPNDSYRLEFLSYMKVLVFIIPIYLILYLFYGLYQPIRRKSFFDEFRMIIKSNIVGFIIVLSILFFQKEIDYSRLMLIVFSSINIILLTFERGLLRLILRNFRRKGFNLKYILIIGAGTLGVEFAQKIFNNPELGYVIIGFLDDEKENEVLNGKKVLGKIEDLDGILKIHRLDEVIIAIKLEEYKSISKIILKCEKNGIKAQIIPAYQEFLPTKPCVSYLDEMSLINVRYIPLDEPLNNLVKRIFDIIFAMFAILITSPLMIFVSILIKITSPGPIIFRQERVGLNRKNFVMYKFRSMKMQKDEEEVTMWTKEKDPRKTLVGRFIRKTSIDELPQFFNVLKGDMSIVGPRPERPYFVEKFKDDIPKYMVKHQVRPGITGYAQANGWRGDTSIIKRIEHDIYYIENWTFGFDIQIILKTIIVGLISKNAY